MKLLAQILSMSLISAVIAGCASNTVYVPQLPTHAEAKVLDYMQQPDNKVFVIAIDPGGDYAFGYDFGKATAKEAAKVAVEKCNANREAYGIVAKPIVYAINNKVVYEEMLRVSAQQGKKDEGKAQVDAVE